MDTQTLSFAKVIKAAPEQVYFALTNGSALREWLCDSSQVAPQPAGRIYLWWNSGYYTSGEFTRLEPQRLVSFSWHGQGEPRDTQVQISLSPQDDGTLVNLSHAGIGTGEAWQKTVNEVQAGWQGGLDNLASVLETGEDLRIVRRPMMGIGLNDLNEEIARQLGVPVNSGIRIDNTIAGLGAQAAGLQKDDVLVGIDDHAITDYPSLTNALLAHYAGDHVKVTYYRGPDRQTAMMELSRRPIPEIIWNPADLAKAVANRYAESGKTLQQFFGGVTEAEASHRPSSTEWSAKEVIAHLIHGERDFQNNISEIVTGSEPVYDDYGGNLLARVEATVAVYPTLPELLAEYKRSTAETVALLAHLPPEAARRKGSYWRLAYYASDNPYHFNGHLDQMRAAIQSAR